MNTAQQHNSTTHRYFYHLLYGLLIIICFFAYCKDDSDMVAPDDPGVVDPDDPPGVVDPDDNKPPFVTLNLDCTEEREEHANCSGTKMITNTIKSDNLPIYTVKRVGPKDKPVTVTLMWDATGNAGSDRQVAYDPAPKIAPFLSMVEGGGATFPFNENKEKGTCNEKRYTGVLDDYVSATYYSFKFIGGLDDEALTTVTPPISESRGSDTALTGTLLVTIPAGSRTATFRLDPHRCPDSTTFLGRSTNGRKIGSKFKEHLNTGTFSGSNVVSIGIQSISDTSGFDDMSSPKALTITYSLNSTLESLTLGSLTLDPDDEIMDAFSKNTGTGTFNIDSDLNKGKLKTAQKEADKVAGKFGTDD